MDIVLGFIFIAGTYIWALFLDRFLKSCSHYAYIQFLNGTGLEIKVLQFKWTTTAFNRTLVRWGNARPKLFNLWFSIGLLASLVLYPVAVYLLFVAFFQNFRPETRGDTVLQPAVPGVNLPASEIGYYSLTLFISSLAHELGHALAAAQDDVSLINVGANVIFVIPVAYVNINSDRLFSLNPWKRLKILCAGVWHNLVVALIAYLLYTSLPHLFSPLFFTGRGVTVSRVHAKSPVSGARGLNAGDTVISINQCAVTGEDFWYDCLSALRTSKPAFCIESDLVHNLDESVNLRQSDGLVGCCSADNKGRLCFEYLVDAGSVLEFPPYVCLPGRTVIEVSRNYCSHLPHWCPSDTFCFRPVLSNDTNLYKIKRVDRTDVIYIGPAYDLLRTLTVSSYVPKYGFLSTAVPDAVAKFLGYVVVFSVGLAIINILPCLFMDGQHITNTLFHIAFSKHLRTTHIKVLSAVVTVSFTFLLVIHCIVAVWQTLAV